MNDEKRKPSKDFQVRYDSAKRWREREEKNLRDTLRFCAPGRELDLLSDRHEQELPIPDIFISYAEEFAGDLASDFVTYYTPPEVRWMDWVVTTPIPEDQADEVEQFVTNREEQIFDLIESSNYYDVAPQIFFEPASHGTAAMWVEQAHLMQPLYVETVPPEELLITPGHMGILDRFREKKVQAQFLPAIFANKDVDLSHPDIQRKIKKPGERVKVTWGFWVDWSDPAVPQWMHEVVVDGHRITKERQVAGPLAGGCPLLVGRFNPRVNRPWGRGPGTKLLPDIFTLDDISEKVLDNLDAALAPSWTYPDDGLLDMRDGIERNVAYPARPGTANTVQKLDMAGNLDYGWFSEERIVERMRVGFYQDGPRQRGDTPPSATQWLDEARRVQKRIGKPSAPLWTEMIYPFVQRVEYIGNLIGKVDEPITPAGDKLSILPVSPLQKAQNQDKVLITRSNLDLAMGVAGDQVGQFVDLKATFERIVETSGDELMTLRKEEQPVEPPASSS